MHLEPSPLFLNDQEVFELTGRKIRRLQIEQLRRMLIPFHINALGKPIIARAIFVGTQNAAPVQEKSWEPRLMQEMQKKRK